MRVVPVLGDFRRTLRTNQWAEIVLKQEAAVRTWHASRGAVKRDCDVGKYEFGWHCMLVDWELHIVKFLSSTGQADLATIDLHWHTTGTDPQWQTAAVLTLWCFQTIPGHLWSTWTTPVKGKTVPSTSNQKGQFPPYLNSSTLFQKNCHRRLFQPEFQVVQKRHTQTTTLLKTSQQFKALLWNRLHQTVDAAIRDRVDHSIEVDHRGACYGAHRQASVEREMKVVWSTKAISFK